MHNRSTRETDMIVDEKEVTMVYAMTKAKYRFETTPSTGKEATSNIPMTVIPVFIRHPNCHCQESI